MNWSHDALLEDLAEHLRANSGRIVWCDMQLGMSGSMRPDIYSIEKSFMHPEPRAYEIKVSRSDFLSDVTSGKWDKYREAACSVYFAVPEGLIRKGEVPDKAGLMVRSAAGWRAVKRAISDSVEIPRRVLLKLIIDGIERQKVADKARSANRWNAEAAVRKKHGEVVAQIVSDMHSATDRLDRIRRAVKMEEDRLEEIRKRTRIISDEARYEKMYESLREECVSALALLNPSDYEITDALRLLRDKNSVDPRIRSSLQALRRIQNEAERCLRVLEEPKTELKEVEVNEPEV